ERVAGIEPASSAWKAAALPLFYTRGADCSIFVRRSGAPAKARAARGGGSRTRTCEGVRQRIYSPPPLPLGTFPRRALGLATLASGPRFQPGLDGAADPRPLGPKSRA